MAEALAELEQLPRQKLEVLAAELAVLEQTRPHRFPLLEGALHQIVLLADLIV
jgi:hypothetical protein